MCMYIVLKLLFANIRYLLFFFFFFQAEDGIRDLTVTGVQTCALPIYRAGNVIPTVRFIWSSNNVSVAKVDNDGTVTGVAGGVAIVEARVGPRRGQAAVQVIGAPSAGTQAGAPPQTTARPTDGTGGVDPLAGQPPGTGPASVMRIEPPTVYLLPSENTRVAPRALKDDGLPAAPVAVTWKSLRPDIASVDGNGVVVALSVGQGTVQVTGSTGLTDRKS